MPHLWIDNAPRPALSGETFPTANPSTGETLSLLARGARADVDVAVASARRAFAGWSRTDPRQAPE